MQRLNTQQVTPVKPSPWGVVGLAYSYVPRLSPTPKILKINTLQTLYYPLGHRDIKTVNKICINIQPETAKNAMKAPIYIYKFGRF